MIQYSILLDLLLLQAKLEGELSTYGNVCYLLTIDTCGRIPSLFKSIDAQMQILESAKKLKTRYKNIAFHALSTLCCLGRG